MRFRDRTWGPLRMTVTPMKTAVREGAALRYSDNGQGGPPLLFIHGWCCDHRFWRGQVSAFEKRHRVVAIDLRGHGESDKPDQDYTIAGFVDDLAWLCGETGIERPVVIGHSMGGVIALNLVRERAGLARAAVLADSPVVPLPAALRPTADATLAALKSPAYVETAKAFVGAFMFREDSDPALRQWVVDGMASAPQRVMWSALESTLSEENMPAGPLPVPALYVRAATQMASADELRGRYPGMVVEEIDSAHFLQMEKPAAFNEMLGQFLEGLG